MAICLVHYVFVLQLVVVDLSLADCIGTNITKSRCNKFCAEIHWQPVSDNSPQLRSKRNSIANNVTFVGLQNEINENRPLKIAYSYSSESPDIGKLIEDYSDVPLTRDEVVLIKAYTYEHMYKSVPQYYSDLNNDCRTYGLELGKYRITKSILREALIKIWSARRSSWSKLYRREPHFLLARYKESLMKKEMMQLSQFTSSSKSEHGFLACPQDSMYTHFIRPQVGVFVRDFSWIPSEDEVILIPWYGNVTVEAVYETQNKAELNGPKEAFHKRDAVTGGASRKKDSFILMLTLDIMLLIKLL